MLGHWGGAPLHGKVVRFQFCCYVGVSDCVQVICFMFVCVLIMKYDQNGIDNDTQRPREQGKVKKTRLVYYTEIRETPGAFPNFVHYWKSSGNEIANKLL